MAMRTTRPILGTILHRRCGAERRLRSCFPGAVLAFAVIAGCNGSVSDAENRGGPCPDGPLFATPVIAIADLDHIVPLGNLNPGTTFGAHTLPTSHTYWNVIAPGTRLISVFAPADIVTLRINRSEFTNPTILDYSLAFAVCDDVEGDFFHMSRLSPSLTSLLTNPHQCTTTTLGNSARTECEFVVQAEVREGELLGSAVEFAFQRGLDFGLRDYRRSLTFANPTRLPPWLPHTVCPVDYYEPAVRAQLESFLGKPGVRRTVPPLCGRIDFDVAGTVQGTWLRLGVSGSFGHDALALAADNVLPGSLAFSIGGVGSAADGFSFYFTGTNTGRVRRLFEQVTADGSVYCYDQVNRRPDLTDAVQDLIVLIQLQSDGRLQFETLAESACGSGPWTFSTAAVTLER